MLLKRLLIPGALAALLVAGGVWAGPRGAHESRGGRDRAAGVGTGTSVDVEAMSFVIQAPDGSGVTVTTTSDTQIQKSDGTAAGKVKPG